MKISIIIPTLKESIYIEKLIHYLQSNSCSENIEDILVVDANSSDQTAEIAKKVGAKVLISAIRSRAIQMNIGAHNSSGDILYFLHADSFPPKDFDKEIIQRVKNKSEAGCFILKFDNAHKFLAFFSWLSKFTGTFFRGGDQSLFITRKLFLALGGYNEELRILEDYDIVKKAKLKTRFFVIKKWIVTSARKYEKIGIYRLQLKFGFILFMYHVGFSEQSILNFYLKNIEK